MLYKNGEGCGLCEPSCNLFHDDRYFLKANKYCGSILLKFLLLTNDYQFFKESDYFESPFETCQNYSKEISSKFLNFSVQDSFFCIKGLHFIDGLNFFAQEIISINELVH